MNLINKFLLLIIIIFLINYLTNGNIIQTIKNYFNVLKKQVDKFTGTVSTDPTIPYARQLDFPFLNHNNNLDEHSYNLYQFINTLITPNVNSYELTASRTKKNKAMSQLEYEMKFYISKHLNTKGYNFNDIRFLEPIYYYENPRGKDFEAFNFSADVSYKGKMYGSVIINVEAFLRNDNFLNKNTNYGYLTILNIKLIDHKYPKNVTSSSHIKSPYKMPKSKLYQKPTPIKQLESFENNNENYNLDDIFIKSTSENNDINVNATATDNSLIPSVINFSCDQQTCVDSFN